MEKIQKLSTQPSVATNKIAIIHVLAGLLDNPLLFTSDEYNFDINDFPEGFHRIIFAAIEHLAKNGMEKIGYIDVDQFLKQYPVQYNVFTTNRGTEYIQNALSMYDPKKFGYYYQTLKKYSLVNSLNSVGIDTKDIFDPDIIDPVESAKMHANFDNLSVDDIILAEEAKLITIKEKYGSNSDRVEGKAGDGLRELKEKFKKTPEMGAPLISPKLTTILRGQRRGCLFLESGSSGAGKSRRGNGEACHLAVPEYYSATQKKWIHTGWHEKVLVISTELELSECQQMWMAFVSGVPEGNIKDGTYGPGEEARVDKAIDLIEQSNLYFEGITNFDIDDITNIIKKYKQLYDVNYVFFDYLGETLKITASVTRQSRLQGMRTDQILLMFSSALKDTAKKLGIFIWTASQLSGDYRTAKELDEAYLRSAKSIADKVDVGMIIMPVREMDRPIIDTYCAHGFELIPNFVVNLYKVRAGSFNNIRIFIYFDRGTCQVTDCFVVDREGKLLSIEDTNVELVLDQTKVENVGKDQDEEAFDFDF